MHADHSLRPAPNSRPAGLVSTLSGPDKRVVLKLMSPLPTNGRTARSAVAAPARPRRGSTTAGRVAERGTDDPWLPISWKGAAIAAGNRRRRGRPRPGRPGGSRGGGSLRRRHRRRQRRQQLHEPGRPVPDRPVRRRPGDRGRHDRPRRRDVLPRRGGRQGESDDPRRRQGQHHREPECHSAADVRPARVGGRRDNPGPPDARPLHRRRRDPRSLRRPRAQHRRARRRRPHAEESRDDRLQVRDRRALSGLGHRLDAGLGRLAHQRVRGALLGRDQGPERHRAAISTSTTSASMRSIRAPRRRPRGSSTTSSSPTRRSTGTPPRASTSSRARTWTCTGCR